jgi:hypothetical protein
MGTQADRSWGLGPVLLLGLAVATVPPATGAAGLEAAAEAAVPAAADLQWAAPVDVARGRGTRGPWQQNESRYDFVDDPTVVLAPDGSALVAWVDQSRKDVLLQRFSAAGVPLWSEPADVSRQRATFSWLPRLALAPDAPHQVYAAWQEIIFSGGSHGGDILFARSSDGGRSFAPPQNLSRSIGGDGKGRIHRELWHNGSFDLAAGPQGRLVAAWTDYDGALWFSRSRDGGRSFSLPRRVAPDGAGPPARAPSLALGPGGQVYLAWSVGEDAAGDVHFMRSTDRGERFTAPVRIAPSPGYSDAPKLAVDAAGVVHLVWAESDGGPFGRHHVRHAVSRDAGRSFGDARVALRPPLGHESVAYPSVALDARGNLHVIAELQRHAAARPQGLAWATSHDGGRSFAAGRIVPHSMDPHGGFNGSSQGLLMKKLAVGIDGGVAIVNSSLALDAHSRIWLMRATP